MYTLLLTITKQTYNIKQEGKMHEREGNENYSRSARKKNVILGVRVLSTICFRLHYNDIRSFANMKM